MDEDRTVRAEGGDRPIVTPEQIGGFQVIFVVPPTVDAIRALKALLKIAWRRYGLRATEVIPRGRE